MVASKAEATLMKLSPFLPSHLVLPAKADSQMRLRPACPSQSGRKKQPVSHVAPAASFSESLQMEMRCLMSPYSSSTGSSPSYRVLFRQECTYTTCAECILDVAQKTARLQVWLWFCHAHGHSEFAVHCFAIYSKELQSQESQRNHRRVISQANLSQTFEELCPMAHLRVLIPVKLLSMSMCLKALRQDFSKSTVHAMRGFGIHLMKLSQESQISHRRVISPANLLQTLEELCPMAHLRLLIPVKLLSMSMCFKALRQEASKSTVCAVRTMSAQNPHLWIAFNRNFHNLQDFGGNFHLFLSPSLFAELRSMIRPGASIVRFVLKTGRISARISADSCQPSCMPRMAVVKHGLLVSEARPLELSLSHWESDCCVFGQSSFASRFRWHRRDSLAMMMERDSLAMMMNSMTSLTVPVSHVNGVLADRLGDRQSNMSTFGQCF